jgi:hypothetical protein
MAIAKSGRSRTSAKEMMSRRSSLFPIWLTSIVEGIVVVSG